jgi:MFS family permease
MRVDPLEIRRQLHLEEDGAAHHDEPGEGAWDEARPQSLSAIQGSAGTRAGFLGVAAAQAVVTTVIVIIGLDLHHRGHDLGATSVVIGALFLGMFALAPVVGRFVDLTERRRALVIGLLLVAAGCAGLLLGGAPLTFVPAAFVIGVGWNVAHVAGTALIGDAAGPQEAGRARQAAELGGLICAAFASVAASIVVGAGGLLPAVVLAVAAAVAPAVFIERERPALAATI